MTRKINTSAKAEVKSPSLLKEKLTVNQNDVVLKSNINGNLLFVNMKTRAQGSSD